MSEQAAPTKVHTEHPKANETIEKLREVAATVKVFGDELEELQDLRDQVGELENALEVVREDKAGELADVLTALDDFRLELCDRDELLRRTIGKT